MPAWQLIARERLPRLRPIRFREIGCGASESLHAVLARHFDDVDPAAREMVFSDAPLHQIARVVFNAIVYANSPKFEHKARIRPASDAEHQGARAIELKPLDYFHLPGHFEKQTVRDLRHLDYCQAGAKVQARLLTPGRWRQANPNWKDKRPRWIAPRWTGPEPATVVADLYVQLAASSA